MRSLLCITVLLFAHFSVMPQSADQERQIEQVRTAVETLAGNRHRAEIMLRDLSGWQGTVRTFSENSFRLKVKGANGKRVTATIAYRDVLEIKSNNILISFIPDPMLRPFGTWDDVLKVSYNHSLEVVLENGRKVTGRLGEITKDKLTLINDDDNEKVVLLPDQIVYVYRVRHRSGKIGGGAIKGRKIGQEIGPTATGKLLGAGLGTLIGSAAGAVSGAVKQEDKLRVLIYSK